MTTLLIFFAVLSLLVVFHESGHYLMARLFGVKAEEFGLGIPPRAIGFVRDTFGWKRIGRTDRQAYPTTVWSLNWLPLGGFVRLKGEQDTQKGDTDSFASKPSYARALILVAGVLMNWVFAILVFFVGFTVGVPMDLDGVPSTAHVRDRRVEITQVVPGAPAAKVGLQPGDRVLRVGDRLSEGAEQVRIVLGEQSTMAKAFTITIDRLGQAKTVVVEPAYLDALKRKGVGVGLADIGVVRLPLVGAFIQAVGTTYAFTKIVFVGFWQMIRDLLVDHRTNAEISGPVGIAVATGRVAEQGWWALAQFAALLSINLAVVNLLPIPALDGGRLMFVCLEVLRRKRTTFHWEPRAHQLGFILLFSVIVLVTVRDVGIYGVPVLQNISHFFYASL